MRHEPHHEEEERVRAAQAVDDDEPPPAAPPPDSPPDPPDPPGDDDFDSGGGDDGEGVELDEVDVKDLLRAAMEAPVSSGRRIADGVHRKIYEASGGRFFADGWSTTPAPRATYIVTSVLMLLVIALAWVLLSPWGL
jgi:hypothetical protein